MPSEKIFATHNKVAVKNQNIMVSIQMPLQAHLLDTWSSAGGATLGGSGNFTRMVSDWRSAFEG
jgi:hypothetical protein